MVQLVATCHLDLCCCSPYRFCLLCESAGLVCALYQSL